MSKKILLLIFAVIIFNGLDVFAASSIANISDNRSSYTNSEIPKYKKLEISFDIDTTTATNFQLPYDATPPAGIIAGKGISVDGLFLPPGETDWNSAIVQPGFWFENFSMAFNASAHADSWNTGKPDWIHAEGKEQWKIRFAPAQTGVWKYKTRVVDASGQTESSEQTFNVISSNSKGFIRVSQTDKRYFEFDNGEIFIPAGLSLMTQGGQSRMWNNPKQTKMVENKLNLFRPWLTAWQDMPIYGGYGSLRSSYFTYLKLAINSTDPYGNPEGVHSGKYSYRKSVEDADSCNYCDDYSYGQFVNTSMPVKPYAKYRYTAWIKTVNLQGPGGVGAKIGSEPTWITMNSLRIRPTGQVDWIDKPLDFTLTGNNDWTQVELTFTNKGRYWIPILGLAWYENISGSTPPTVQGTAYFDDLSLKEVLDTSGTLGPEQLDKGDMEFNEHFAQRYSYHFDKLLEWAENNGIYFKVSIEEKQEETYTRVKDDGSIDATWRQWDGYENYAGRAAGNTPLKWYEKAYWRYLIARWGYSTSIHSWEQFNEQNPASTFVWQLTSEFGTYMRQNDPNKHLTTTSFWDDFPALEFWANSAYPNVDYADFHRYFSSSASATGYAFWENYFTANNIEVETRPGYVYGGKGYSIKIGAKPPSTDITNKVVTIHGKGTWTIKYLMKAENLDGTHGSDGLLMGGLIYFIDGAESDKKCRVPKPPSGQCLTFQGNIPSGTYDWVEFKSTFELSNDLYHKLYFSFDNYTYTSGNAWIDNLEITDPAGKSIYLNGDFDLSNKNSNDLAQFIYQSAMKLADVGKPIIWGEAGLDGTAGESSELKQDTSGVGFHNIVWSQINSSGVAVLYWYHVNEIFDNTHNWIRHFKPYVLFMQNIPLNNGNYRDVRATTSDINLRVWGQKDTINNKAHLWIQNKQNNWRNTVDKIAVNPVNGTITVPNMNDTSYLIDWWDTYSTTATVIRKTKARAYGGNLSFYLPNSLSTDVAVKVSPFSVTGSASLDWTGETGYTNDGVDPESGYSNTNFTFRVKYTDSGNYFPAYVHLLLDKSGTGAYDTINMDEFDPADNDVTGPAGKIYTKTVTIPYTSAANSKNVSYKFEASDGVSSVAGVPTAAINLPDINIDLSLSISSGQVNLGQLNLASFSQPAYITVNNTSNEGLSAFTLQLIQGGNWSADTTSGVNTYVLKALFTGTGDAVAVGDFNDDDIVTTTMGTASLTKFGDSKFSANGASVSAGTSIRLWLLFKTPQTTSLQGDTNTSVTVGIIEK